MSKNFYFQISLLVLLSVVGCDTEIPDAYLPYEEKLVIRGIVQAGDIVDSLYLGRTLPYEEQRSEYYNPNDTSDAGPELESYITDAVVTVSNGIDLYTMNYTGGGYYKNDSLVGEAGKTYRLHVEWKGKIADAVTTVPETPIIDSVSVTTSIYDDANYGSMAENTCSVFVRTNANDVLYLTTELIATVSTVYPQPHTDTSKGNLGYWVVKRTREIGSAADIFTRKFTMSKSFLSNPNFNLKIFYTLSTYDEAYYKYYLTYGNGDGDSKPVSWNVTGDAIGMFIGLSQSVTKTYSFQ